MRNNEHHTWHSVDAAAAKIGCSKKDIQDRIKSGTIPSVQTVGKTWVNVERFIETPRLPVKTRPARSPRTAALACSLLLVTALTAVAATWGIGRLANLKTQLHAERSANQTIHESLQLSRLQLEQTRKQIDESNEQIRRFNTLIDVAGKELAQRDAVAQTAHAKLSAHNNRLNDTIAQLQSQLAQAHKELADQYAATHHAQAPALNEADIEAPDLSGVSAP